MVMAKGQGGRFYFREANEKLSTHWLDVSLRSAPTIFTNLSLVWGSHGSSADVINY